ncbi:MAG: hypothetical protein IJ499_04855 [Clostridia bacterium]|nr:hypothetical protein [Clostridia bacterium]
MAEKNNNEITAKSLLSRLKKGAEEAPSVTDSFEAAEENLVAPDLEYFGEAFEEEFAESDVMAETPAEEYDAPVYSEPTEAEISEAIGDFDMNSYFGGESGEYSDDEWAEAFSELSEDELAAEIPDEYGEYAQMGFADVDDEPQHDGIDSLGVLEIAETNDDFDNDPLENTSVDIAVEEEPVELDETAAFEALVSEVVGEETDELDEADISLMVGLGMEDELARTFGQEDAEKLTDDFVADQEEWVDRTANYAPDEYNDVSQNRKIAVEYTNKNKWGFIRLVAAALVTFGILIYENMPVFGYQVAGVFDPAVYPVVYLMGGLQMLFIVAALAYPSLIDGFKSIFALKLTASSIAAVATVAATVNTVHMAFAVVPGVEPKLFNLPCAMCLLMAVANEFFTNRREIFSFNIVSSKNPKYVMRKLNTKDSQLENQAVADFSEENTGDIVKIAKTDFVEGYFRRTNNRGTVDKPFVTLIVILSCVLSLIIGLYVLLTHKEGSAVETMFTTLVAVLPVSALCVNFYPFYRANREAYYNDCTIIGEGAVEEYSDTEVISFDDVNVFPSINVKVRNVRLYNNCRIDKVLYYAASVFSATGGPLADVFEVATMDMGHSDDVQILETGSGFIEATVNGKNILFAKEEALLQKGITIPESVLASDVSEELSPDCSIMYMIYQKRLVSKMILSYVIDADFEYILRQLTDSGMYVCIKTFDPNIDEVLVNRQVTSGSYPLKVIKYKGTEEITKYSERTEGGIVSRGTTKALLQTISCCDKIVGAKKTGYVLSIIAAIISVLIMCAAVVTGKGDSVYSLYAAINQIIWLIPVLISTKVIVR